MSISNQETLELWRARRRKVLRRKIRNQRIWLIATFPLAVIPLLGGWLRGTLAHEISRLKEEMDGLEGFGPEDVKLEGPHFGPR